MKRPPGLFHFWWPQPGMAWARPLKAVTGEPQPSLGPGEEVHRERACRQGPHAVAKLGRAEATACPADPSSGWRESLRVRTVREPRAQHLPPSGARSMAHLILSRAGRVGNRSSPVWTDGHSCEGEEQGLGCSPRSHGGGCVLSCSTSIPREPRREAE